MSIPIHCASHNIDLILFLKIGWYIYTCIYNVSLCVGTLYIYLYTERVYEGKIIFGSKSHHDIFHNFEKVLLWKNLSQNIEKVL